MFTHPNYDNAETFNEILSALASKGFADSSYKNDTCPSIALFEDEDAYNYTQIWIDYKDPEMREDCDLTEFFVVRYAEGERVESYAIDCKEELLKKLQIN